LALHGELAGPVEQGSGAAGRGGLGGAAADEVAFVVEDVVL
jgi:hypothetical protein